LANIRAARIGVKSFLKGDYGNKSIGGAAKKQSQFNAKESQFRLGWLVGRENWVKNKDM
jgi:hypothetical protein